ncbi:MAG: M23 family metallopeptidase, partial [Chloroflexi bacterium]|nr:M23 family metallopeptidase [Chloroflexota bacterium]
AEPLVHTVRLGETVSELALRYAVTVDGIAAANDLADPRRISVGQTLLIPQPGQTARPEPAVTASRHRVQPGETLPGIALRYGVTVGALAAANDLPQTAQITPGIVLSIPSVQAGTTSVIHAASGPGLCPDVAITRSGSGYFVRPVEQYVLTRGFFSTHQAVDLAWDLGSPVKAADGGTVVYAGWNDYGYGNLVVLDHGRGWRTYYAHLRTVSVECGAWAARGSVIGALGSTGNSTGPHLHFELLRFGIAVDPEGYIRF